MTTVRPKGQDADLASGQLGGEVGGTHAHTHRPKDGQHARHQTLGTRTHTHRTSLYKTRKDPFAKRAVEIPITRRQCRRKEQDPPVAGQSHQGNQGGDWDVTMVCKPGWTEQICHLRQTQLPRTRGLCKDSQVILT